jgi:ubiquinone/menaquinone biosynthesis C-methylase UbiE
MDPRTHWQNVYTTRKPTAVSWYQPAAVLSLTMIRRVAPDRSARIVDVGGGASTLVDGLVAEGYGRVTVLDVSSAALALARARLGADAERVTWLEANVLEAALPSSG